MKERLVRRRIATKEIIKRGDPGSERLFPTIVVATMVGARPKTPPTI